MDRERQVLADEPTRIEEYYRHGMLIMKSATRRNPAAGRQRKQPELKRGKAVTRPSPARFPAPKSPNIWVFSTKNAVCKTTARWSGRDSNPRYGMPVCSESARSAI